MTTPRGGRPRKPTAQKIAEGNPGKEAKSEIDPTREVRPAPGAPECPGFLRGEARSEWDALVAHLGGAGMLSKVDRAALAQLCQAWGRWVRAEKRLARKSLVIKHTNGSMVPNPYLQIAWKEMENVRRLLSEFGLTPSARAGLRIPVDPPKETGDRWAEFARMSRVKGGRA